MGIRQVKFGQLRLRWVAYRAWASERYGKGLLTEFEKSIHGVWPTSAASSDLILVACDDVYFEKFAKGFLRSVAETPGQHAVHIHLLEPSQATVDQVELLRSSTPISLTYTIDPCIPTRGLRLRHLYFNASRFVLATLLLQRGVRNMLILDVDTLMNGSPWEKIEQLERNVEVALIQRPEKVRLQYKILASAVVYRLAPHSLKFSSAFARAVLAGLKINPRNHVDQILPYYLLQFAGADRADWFADVPKGIVDYEFDPHAAFWTAKGANKHADDFARRFAT
jgi:hypothetical protein